MISKYLGNSRGFTLIQIMFVTAVVVSLSVLSMTLITNANKSKEESTITSNITQLESSAKTYYINKNSYPVKDAIKLSEYSKGSSMKIFFDSFVKLSGFSNEAVDGRIKLVDVKTLKGETYLSSDIDDPESYVLDKKTGKVYNIHRDAKIHELEEVVKKIISDAGDIIDLNKNNEFTLEKNGKTMTKVISTVTQGNKMVVGGDGTMKVAVVTLSDSDEKVFHEIDDLTPKLTGTAPEAVTEVVLVDTGKVLVHYFNGKELSYLTLNF